MSNFIAAEAPILVFAVRLSRANTMQNPKGGMMYTLKLSQLMAFLVDRLVSLFQKGRSISSSVYPNMAAKDVQVQ